MAHKPVDPDRDALLAAPYASLTNRAVTDEARSLVDTLTQMLRDHELATGARKNKRKSTESGLRNAVEGFVGDILLAQASKRGQGWIAHSTRRESFTGGPVSWRTFDAVYTGLNELGLITYRPGFQGRYKTDDGDVLGKPYAPRFRATPRLVRLSSDAGLPPNDAARHFIESLPQHPLKLRATSTRDVYGQKERGKLLKFSPTGKAERLEQEVAELNEFFDQFELRGGVHRGFTRIFNNGDDEKFRWNMGGRLYSLRDDSFQQMDQDKRILMTIGGEQVCEIDIKASWLTIFHGWHGEQLDFKTDPYDRLGFDREARHVVKSWFTATWGSGKHIDRWPRKIAADYLAATGRKLSAQFRVSAIKERALRVYPLLQEWGGDKNEWARFMYVESEAIVSTMLRLKREHNVPSLAVHDSLIVPKSKATITKLILTAEYEKATRATPFLVENG